MRLIDPRVTAVEIAELMAYEANMAALTAGYHYTKDDYIDIVEEWLENVPTIEAEPVRRGRWIEDEVDKYICSECGAGNHYAYSWSVEKGKALQDLYCPKCGAKMEEQ